MDALSIGVGVILGGIVVAGLVAFVVLLVVAEGMKH